VKCEINLNRGAFWKRAKGMKKGTAKAYVVTFNPYYFSLSLRIPGHHLNLGRQCELEALMLSSFFHRLAPEKERGCTDIQNPMDLAGKKRQLIIECTKRKAIRKRYYSWSYFRSDKIRVRKRAQ
jgi:hypothetical protein